MPVFAICLFMQICVSVRYFFNSACAFSGSAKRVHLMMSVWVTLCVCNLCIFMLFRVAIYVRLSFHTAVDVMKHFITCKNTAI